MHSAVPPATTPEKAADHWRADRQRPLLFRGRPIHFGECASHVVAEVALGAVAGKGAGEQSQAGNAQLKTSLPGPRRVLRSNRPDMVRREVYGYVLTRYAMSVLICRAATEPGIDPDRVKFKRTVRIVRRRPGGLFPLSSKNASSLQSWPTSAWSTCARSHAQHDQLTMISPRGWPCLRPSQPGANPGTQAGRGAIMYP